MNVNLTNDEIPMNFTLDLSSLVTALNGLEETTVTINSLSTLTNVITGLKETTVTVNSLATIVTALNSLKTLTVTHSNMPIDFSLLVTAITSLKDDKHVTRTGTIGSVQGYLPKIEYPTGFSKDNCFVTSCKTYNASVTNNNVNNGVSILLFEYRIDGIYPYQNVVSSNVNGRQFDILITKSE